jgi:hypothetical protein
MENSKQKFNFEDAEWVKCGDAYLYDSSLMFKRISPILSPTGKEEFVPVEVVVCKTCGKVPTFIAKKIPGIPSELISDCK